MARRKTTDSLEWPEHNLRFNPRELARHLKINKNALDEEVEQQPEIYGEVADAAALAKSQVDALEERLKETEADLDMRIRTEAEQAGERLTENQIRNEVAGHKERKTLAIKLIKAKELRGRLEALERAYRHKSYALRDMVDLYLSQYYSPRSAEGSKRHLEDAEAANISKRMGERRKRSVSRKRQRTPTK